ncbi:MAG: multidrug efflux MFS transporter, partial [Chloroflexi bacterium]|nr:multidrug efflux MFS transporter [Chloroflexota bacterium]
MTAAEDAASIETVTETSPEDEARYKRIILAIASGAFLASFAMNFWWPFLPLFLRQIGATSDANALFWVGVATTVQGVARLVSGPIWGVISDRYGRKLMLVRALYAATLTTAIAAVAHAPWVVVVALSMQGLFSGFIPAAIALTSVSVPDERLNRSLGVVTGGQYLGSTLGPAVGALLAIGFGYRGAIVASAVLPALAATWIIVAVPRDSVAPRAVRA